jgi:hypothetical protein
MKSKITIASATNNKASQLHLSRNHINPAILSVAKSLLAMILRQVVLK